MLKEPLRFHIFRDDLEEALEVARQESVYVHPSKVPVRKIYQDKGRVFWITEGISHSALFFAAEEFRQSHSDSSRYFFTLSWFHDVNVMKSAVKALRRISKDIIRLDQMVVLANTKEELDAAKSLGLSNSILCNANAWINFDYFKIYECGKLYDLVLNTRPEKWKRPYLASLVENLAIIKGYNHRKSDYYDLSQLKPKYMNEDRLHPGQVAAIINQSYVGGIFSEIEGGCYSSSEYLLCGVPVLSTRSKGGRDVWYNEDNSEILTEDTPEAVREGVARLKSKVLSKEISPERIRQGHISQQLSFRREFLNLVTSFVSEPERFDANEWWQNIYIHKMVAYNDLVVLDQ